jgi:hypothetical protein
MDKYALFQHLNLNLEKPIPRLADLDLILKQFNLGEQKEYKPEDIEYLTEVCQTAFTQKGFKRNIDQAVDLGSQGLSQIIGRRIGKEQVLLEITTQKTIEAELAWLANSNNRPKIIESIQICKEIILNSDNSDEARTQWLKTLQSHRITTVPPRKVILRVKSRSPLK